MARTTTYPAPHSDGRLVQKNRRVRQLALFVILGLFAAISLPGAEAQAPAPSAVVINEILAANQGSITGILDEDGDSPDYIELRNQSDQSVSLASHVLVDGDNIWPFPPGTTIEAGGYLLIWASGKDRSVPALHTNFELSREGEYLALVDGANAVVAELAPAYPAQQQNVSWGILPDGSPGFMTRPTPDAENVAGVAVGAPAPQASVGRGFYASAVVERLTSSPGAQIRYTLDGSAPTSTSPLYTSQIVIAPSATGIVTLRAKAFGEGGLASEERSWSYLFPESLYQGLAGDGLSSLPAVVVNTDDLRYPVDTETRRGAIEMIEVEAGRAGFAVTAGVKEFGESSVDFEKSNLRLFFDGEFGPSNLDYAVFDGYGQGTLQPATSFDKLELRGGSWDSWQAAAGGRFAPSDYYLTDRFLRDTRLDMGGLHTHGRFVNVWVNGDYRGVYHLRERFDHAFAASYAVDGESPDTFEAIKQNEGRYSNNGDQNINGTGAVFDGLTGAWATDKDWVDAAGLIDFTLVMSLGEDDFEQEFRGVGSMQRSSPNDYQFIYNDNDMRLRPVSSVLGSRIGFSPGYFVPPLVPFFETYRDDPEFLQLVRQRTERHFCAGGALTVTAMSERLAYWRSEIDLAMRAEHVRWDGWSSIDYFGVHTVEDKYGSWNENMDSIARRIVDLMPDMYSAWQAEGLFAGCDNLTPQVIVDPRNLRVGQEVSAQILASDPDGDELAFSGTGLPDGLTIDATTGVVGGTVLSPGVYDVSIRVDDTRGAWAESAATWTASEGESLAGQLVITEIMYHPSADEIPFGLDPDLGGFVEVANVGSDPLELSGAAFADGVTFAFPPGVTLEPGSYLVIAESAVAFERIYGWAPDHDYAGGLANTGERLALVDRFGDLVDEVTFDDQAPWPIEPDGLGPSLELSSTALDNNDPAAWVSSAQPSGTPGQPNRPTGAESNCDGVRSVVDALVIAQFDAGNRQDIGSCPLVDPATQINASAGDINDDGRTDIVDALLVSQCVVGIVHGACSP